MLLLFPVEPLSDEGERALVRRYGDADADLPTRGLWRAVDPRRGGFDALDVIEMQISSALAPGFRRRAEDAAPSDLDASGRCRCGCGMGARTEPMRIATVPPTSPAEMLDAEARRLTLRAVREALPELDDAEAMGVAEMLLRDHGGRPAVVFPHPRPLRPSIERNPTVMVTCVARFGRLRLSDDERAEAACVQSIETR